MVGAEVEDRGIGLEQGNLTTGAARVEVQVPTVTEGTGMGSEPEVRYRGRVAGGQTVPMARCFHSFQGAGE